MSIAMKVAPGRPMLTYDRIPCDWRRVPADSVERNRIFVLPIALNTDAEVASRGNRGMTDDQRT